MMHIKRRDIIAGLNAPCEDERRESVYEKKKALGENYKKTSAYTKDLELD